MDKLNIVTFPCLYKMTSTGATQQWYIEVFDNSDETSTIRVVYGQLDGKMQTTDTIIKAGKNVGRANVTTIHEQAVLESSAKWKKQKDKGYGENVQVVRPEQKPMLAHKYNDYKHKISWDNAWAQPKLDGIRCIARWEDGEVKLYSRGNKPILTMDHITAQLKVLMDLYEGTAADPKPTYDGELYVHGEKFQDIVSWVKRKQPDSLKIEYHIYDVIAPEAYCTRMTYYEAKSPASRFGLTNIKGVLCEDVYNEEDLKKWHDKWVQDGYEGAMLRWGECLYKEGYRSQQLLKYKAFDDDEFVIVGAKQGKGRFEGMCVFQCVTEDGGEFDCMPMGSTHQRRDYYANRYEHIGRKLTVRYFGMSTSVPPLPRFPIGVAIRNNDY